MKPKAQEPPAFIRSLMVKKLLFCLELALKSAIENGLIWFLQNRLSPNRNEPLTEVSNG